MKKISFFIFMLAQQMFFGQAKSSISILPLSYDSESLDKSTATLIQETIINSFFSTKNFTIVDRERLADIEKEKKLQKTEEFMDNNTEIKSGINIGASYLISPSLVSIYPKAIQIKLLNVSTGEILASDMVSAEPRDFPEKALEILKKVAKLKKDELHSIVKGNSEMQSLKINIISYINSNIPNIVKNVTMDRDEYTLNTAGLKIGDLYNLYIKEGNKKTLIGKGVITYVSGNEATGRIYDQNKKNYKMVKMLDFSSTGENQPTLIAEIL